MAFVITGSAMAADYEGQIYNQNLEVGGAIDATVGSNTIENNVRYAIVGAENPGQYIVSAKELNITANVTEDKYDRLYGIGIASVGTSMIINADNINMDITSNKAVRGIRNNYADKLTINGNIYGTLISNGGGDKIGIDAWGDIEINGNVDITMKAEAVGEKSLFMGVQNFGVENTNIDFNGDFKFNGITSTLGLNSDGEYQGAQGVNVFLTTTNFNKSADISIDYNGDKEARVVSVQCDDNDVDTIINFKGDTTLKAVSKDAEVKGVYISGIKGGVNFTGSDVLIDVKTNSKSAIGILSQYGAHVFGSDKTNFVINATSTESEAYGIEVGEYASANGNIDFKGNVTINVNAKDAFGLRNIANTTVPNPGDGKVNIGGDVNIIAKSNGGRASGIYSSGDYAVTTVLGNVNITAKDYALFATENSTMNIGSEGKKITLSGDISAQNKAVINFVGDSEFNKDNTEFSTVNGGIINLAGGNMSGVLNIANGSKVNLTGATFTANDLATDIVGEGKLVLTDSGVLSTTADQIFTKADTVGSDFVGNAITDTANKKVDFVGGTVSLTDKEYNFDFVQSAVDTMQKHNSSKTNVVMTGTLVGGVEDNRVTVDEAAGLGNDVALDKVTAEAEGNLLVGSTKAEGDTVEEIEIKDSVANGFNVDSLELAAGSNGMVITNAQEVTLGGSDGGSVITVVNNAEAKVHVVVGTDKVVDGANKTTGTLNIGNALANADTEYTLNGSVTVNADSTLNTKGNTTITDDIELNGGSVNAVNGKLEANTIVVNEGTNTITGNVSGIFSAKQGTVTNIGTADASASTSFENVNLNGSTICFDPAWDKAAGQHGMVFDKNVDGNVQIARNNYVAIGTADTTGAKAMFEKTGLKFGEKDITAVLYIAGNQKLAADKGSISIDGSKAASGDFGAVTAGSFNAAANSLTMVEGSKIKDNAALSGVTSTTIDQDSAKLYIDGAKKGETYHVIAGADAGWADKNIISDNSLLEFKGDTATDGKYDVTASLKKVNDVYGNKVIIANVVDNTLDKHDKSAAADFFNAAVNNKINASSDAQISALNSAGAMSELAGVAHSTYAVSNILTDAVADHVSLSNELEHDSDIWAHYVHNKENVKGLPVAGFGADYDAKYNGIVVGGDFYKKDNVVAGAALTYVDGSINGSTLAARTENDAEYYGVSVYGSVTNDDNAVIGDISYLHGKNEITQHNSGFALTGEPESDAFSVGVRVEKAIETDGGKFVPYAGVRYMHVGTGNYTNSIGMSYDADDANLLLLPVGLKYSAEAKVGSMTIRPVAEVGYVWAMGDTDTAQTVSLNGAADGFGYDVTDEGSYFARIGVEAVSDNVTYGLGYEYQKGDSVKANKWMANLNFSF